MPMSYILSTSPENYTEDSLAEFGVAGQFAVPIGDLGARNKASKTPLMLTCSNFISVAYLGSHKLVNGRMRTK